MADQNSPNTLSLSAKISILKFVLFLDADYGNIGRAFHAIGRPHGLVSYEIGKIRFRGAIALARGDALPPIGFTEKSILGVSILISAAFIIQLFIDKRRH